MSDPFFQRKRKRSASAGGSSSAGASLRRHTRGDDVDAAGSESDEAGAGAVDDLELRHTFDDTEAADDAARETPAETKVRLAKMYLEGLREKEDDDGIDAAAVDRENIAARLRRDVDETSGRLHVFVADRVQKPRKEDVLAVRGHRAPITCARTSTACDALFTADKDGRIVQWSLRDGRQLCILPRGRHLDAVDSDEPLSTTSGAARRRARVGPSFQGAASLRPGEGHTDAVLSLSLSDDGRLLASGGRDRRIGIWSVASGETRWVKALSGHKDAVRAVAFREGSHELFSASADRSVKVFDAAQQSYIETLFGHQEAIEDLACLRAERAVSAGGRERTVRLWKVREESQLVFRGGVRSRLHALLEGGDLVDTPTTTEVHEGSIDAVAMIDDHHFVSGSDSGSLSLWSVAKKKPLCTVPVTHGWDVRHAGEGPRRLPRGITSIACLPYGDVFATGSWGGNIRLWALDRELRSFTPLHTLPAKGFVTSLQLLTPAVDDAGAYPVVPSAWRRRGGVDAPLTAAKVAEAHSIKHAPRSRLAVDAAGRVLGHKESIAPLLVASVAPEPRTGRWHSVCNATTGVIVVPLWLDGEK